MKIEFNDEINKEIDEEIRINDMFEEMLKDVEYINNDFNNWLRYAAKQSELFKGNKAKYEYIKAILTSNHKKLKFKINYLKMLKLYNDNSSKRILEIYYKNRYIGFIEYYIDSDYRFKYNVQVGFMEVCKGVGIWSVFQTIIKYILLNCEAIVDC